MKEKLRRLKVLNGTYPEFNMDDVPHSPYVLFTDWLNHAIEVDVQEPHAMTLSTVRHDGSPDARVLILKNVDEQGWYFASSTESKKGEQLKNNDKAALTFYWPQVGRQIRIRGTVYEMDSQSSAEDYLARKEQARAAASIGMQSKILNHRSELERALTDRIAAIQNDPDYNYPGWKLYRVAANEVEFWQADRERKHLRLYYRLHENGWLHHLLWP